MSSNDGFFGGEGLLASVLYRTVQTLIVLFGKVWWRLSIEGKENLPEGPFVLSPVHRSNLDTPLMAIVPRRLRFMGKDSLWKVRWGGWFLTALGGFPVERGTADREALNRTIGIVEAGEPVVLFAEGQRRTGPTLFPLFDGPAYVAGRTQVPIVPVGIGGSEASMPKGAKFIRPHKIHVIVGAPLPPPARKESGRVSRAGVRERTEELAKVLQELFDEAQVKAGTPNR
jgi:1-acyl-sn-glycerol-3-phosphate acyltransferase